MLVEQTPANPPTACKENTSMVWQTFIYLQVESSLLDHLRKKEVERKGRGWGVYTMELVIRSKFYIIPISAKKYDS